MLAATPAHADEAPPPPAPVPSGGVEEPKEEFHVGFRFSAGIGLGYAHYAESDTGPNPGSFTLDGPGMPLPLLMAGVQITPNVALVGTVMFHPFYAVGGSFVPGGFAALGAVISPTRAFDLDLDFVGGGLGVGGVFGGQGPAGSVGATFYPVESGHWAFGPAARLTVQGVLVHYPGGNDGAGYLVSPTLGVTGTYR